MLNPNRPVILIGGAPTVGKSTLAEKLANHLHLPWISTDQIRDIMQITARKEDWPELSNALDMTAAEYWEKLTPGEAVQKEVAQSKEVWVGIKHFIEKDYTFEKGVVIEGINIEPALVHQEYANKKNVRSVFVVDNDRERIRNVVYRRGVWADAHTYSDSVKEKEVEWVIQHNKYIISETNKYSLPLLSVEKDGNDLQRLLEVLKQI